jgi:hypothetical protein
MNQEYKYAEIMKAYNPVKEIAEQNIGLDTHEMRFTKNVESIDLIVIDQELARMYDAGGKVAEIFPNENIFKTFFKMITVPGYMNKAANIADYVNSTKRELVHRYGIEISHPEDAGHTELSPHIVTEDLHNEFNNGIIDAYNGNPKKFFFTFSSFRVVKKLEKISEN